MWQELYAGDALSGRYMISSEGVIVDKLLNQQLTLEVRNGYQFVYIYTNQSPNRKQCRKVHQLVADSFLWFKPKGDTVVNHKDLNKSNNNVTNLEYVTNKENSRHAVRNHARKLCDGVIEPKYPNAPIKQNIHNRVFSEEQIHSICKMMEQNLSYPEILENLNLPVSKNLLDILTKIRSKKLWYCISKEYNIPNKEYRSPQIQYTTDQIKQICELLTEGYSTPQIATKFNIDLSNNKERDKFQHLVQRIKNKTSFTQISDEYF